MRIVQSPDGMQHLAMDARRNGQKIAFVPTMGFLHEGHLSLCRAARERGDLVVLSIFVNPTQFGQGEDFEVYPRDLNRDAELAKSTGVDILFAPDAASMYPDGYATYVDVERLTEPLCGANRPGHFRGVTTVVAKLFNIVRPDMAFFGQKDFQQLAVIRRMTRDMNFPVEIVGMPIVREEDGLAMSSRNVNLSGHYRHQALALVDALRVGVDAVRQGKSEARLVLLEARNRIGREPDADIDYIQICHRDTLEDMEQVTEDSVLLLAVRFGDVRLIDNHVLNEELNV